MANVVMRNRVTSEYRKIEKDGEEFWALRAELHTDGRPRWEQTGEHDLAAFANRVEAGQLRAEDVGDQDQPVEVIVESGGATAVGLDRGWPTPGELEQSAGRAADMSDEELSKFTVGGGAIVEGYPAGNPPQVDPDEAAEAGVSLGGGLSGPGQGQQEKLDKVAEEAEGSDAVSDQPTAEDPSIPGAGSQGSEEQGGESSPKADAGSAVPNTYSVRSVSQLKSEIQKRNATRSEDDMIRVAASARKAVLISALKADDERHQE